MINQLVDSRKNILIHYSPYSYLREIDSELVFDKTVLADIYSNDNTLNEILVAGKLHVFIIEYLQWDSQFYNIPTYKLKYILFEHNDIKILSEAIGIFLQGFMKERKYCFAEIPSEDIFLIQALGLSGFKLIETRLNHYLDNLTQYNYPRYKVREANYDDIPILRDVSRTSINRYDRLHADTEFEDTLANQYLETYIENAIKGFCDFVLVPDEKGIPPKAFMAASMLKGDSESLKCQLSRLKLAAVNVECKGWYIKLASETIYEFIKRGAAYVLVTTQATNKAAFRSSEKLGFKLGSVTHVFSKSN